MKEILNSDNENKILNFKNSSIFLKLNWKRLSIAFLISCTIVLLGHALLPVAPHIANINNHSFIAIKFGFPTVAVVYTFFTYILLITTICLIIPFVKNFKSSLFTLAIAFGLLWFLGMFEALFPEETYLDLLIIAINDSIPVFLVIFLIAKYPKSFQNDSTVEVKDENNKTILIFYPLVTIIFSFMGVRIIGYYILKMTSRISDMPFEIISWTFFMGLLIGIMYIMYQKIEHRTLWLHRVIRFTFILFGINWVMFNIFVPLLLRESFIDFLIYRAVFDIFAVFIGVSLGELLKNKIIEIAKRQTTHNNVYKK